MFQIRLGRLVLKQNNNMKSYIKSNIFRLCAPVLLCAVASLSGLSSFAAAQTGEQVTVSISVIDEDGNPVPGAEFSINEGAKHYISDSEGKIYFIADPQNLVTISADGFRTANAIAAALADSKTYTLVKNMFLTGEGYEIPLPYDTKQSKRNALGNTIVIKGEDLEKYSSTDIRNALTAIASGVEVTEKYGGPGVSPLEHTGQYNASTRTAVTTRGRQVIYMVDDIPVVINETPLDPQQIESITIVRDPLEKNIFGASGGNGIVYIKTKRGKYNDRYLNVDVEGGISTVDRFPEYVSGADYARLNNIARANSGLDPVYSQDDIDAYALGNPYDIFHPSVDYKDMMLKNYSYYTRAGVSSGGGNDRLRYYAYLGYAGEDDLYKIGAAANYNRVNINANLDVKLHKYIGVRFGIISTVGVRKSPNYGYNGTSFLEFREVMEDIRTIPAIAFPVYASSEPDLEFPWYAVSAQHTDNPIANMQENGSYTETIRKGIMNVGLDVDFSFLTPGLKSLTYMAFDVTNLTRIGTRNDYAAYILTPGLDPDTGFETLVPVQSGSHTVNQTSNMSKFLDYYSNRLFLFEKLSYDRTFGQHDVSAFADYMITKRAQMHVAEHQREINFGFGGTYSYAGKYIASITGNYHGTYFLQNNNWGFSPAVGFGWVMSEEDFMDNASSIDFLKLRVQGGYLSYDTKSSANMDIDDFTYRAGGQRFGPYTQNQWFGSTVSEPVPLTYPFMLGNPNLRMERRTEFTAGMDLVAFNKRFNASLNYYYMLEDDQITKMSYLIPSTFGTSSASIYMNYNSTQYHGYEVSLRWQDKIGDFSYSIMGWGSGQFSKVLKADEPNYREDYRLKVGKSATAIRGLKCIGQFQTDEEAMAEPQRFDTELKAGDLKYEDMNGDGIVDQNDACVIGDSSPKLIYGLVLNLKYKNFDLLVTGTGRAFYDIAMTNEYFWNGWGDNNYSRYVLDNVNNPNHPRLTYNKVNNNYQTSSFWLEDGGFFKLQTVELGYEFPMKKWNVDVVRRLRLYVRGNNLGTITGIKYVDPEQISAGVLSHPLMRTFVLGVKVTF